MKSYAARLGVLISIAAEGSFLYVGKLDKHLAEWDVGQDVIDELFSLGHLERKFGLDREEIILTTLEGKDWVRNRLKEVETPSYW
jgi:hypothetical protein